MYLEYIWIYLIYLVMITNHTGDNSGSQWSLAGDIDGNWHVVGHGKAKKHTIPNIKMGWVETILKC